MNTTTDRMRRWLIGGAILTLGGCATSEDVSTWREHPTHFASAQHMQFSFRNLQSESPDITPEDTEAAQDERWWGQLVPAAYPPDTAHPPDTGHQAENTSQTHVASRADIAGRWTGTWSSDGPRGVTRGSVAKATFTQNADAGEGTLIFADAMADENVPYSLRWAGSLGIPVALSVVGSDVSLRAMSVRQPFTATLSADGDVIIGRVGETQIRLTRVR